MAATGGPPRGQTVTENSEMGHVMSGGAADLLRQGQWVRRGRGGRVGHRDRACHRYRGHQGDPAANKQGDREP